MIVTLDEYSLAEKIISEKNISQNKFNYLALVAKYYLHKGYSKKNTRAELDKFLLQCKPNASLVLESKMLDGAVTYAINNPLVQIDSIPISNSELDCVRSLKRSPLQRLAFTLLCLAKYSCLVNPKYGYWVNIPDKDIMAMANIKASIKRQSELFAALKAAGLIRFSKNINNLSVNVLFVDNEPPAVLIKDLRNLGYRYMYIENKNDCYECEICGNVGLSASKSGGRPKRYCPECATSIRIQQTIELNNKIRKGDNCSDNLKSAT